MENVTFIQDLISTMGFPIVMVGYFIWDKYKTMQPIIDAVNNNTKILSRLLTKMDEEDLLENE